MAGNEVRSLREIIMIEHSADDVTTALQQWAERLSTPAHSLLPDKLAFLSGQRDFMTWLSEGHGWE